jgi:hypothetical protein
MAGPFDHHYFGLAAHHAGIHDLYFNEGAYPSRNLLGLFFCCLADSADILCALSLCLSQTGNPILGFCFDCGANIKVEGDV